MVVLYWRKLFLHETPYIYSLDSSSAIVMYSLFQILTWSFFGLVYSRIVPISNQLIMLPLTATDSV